MLKNCNAKRNIIVCIWCNAMCLCGLRFEKHNIFHILYILVAPLCSTFLKRAIFYIAHRSEKWGVLWLASYPVRCDWLNTSSVRRKCYAPYRIVMPCPGTTTQKPIRNKAFVSRFFIRHIHNYTEYKRHTTSTTLHCSKLMFQSLNMKTYLQAGSQKHHTVLVMLELPHFIGTAFVHNCVGYSSRFRK